MLNIGIQFFGGRGGGGSGGARGGGRAGGGGGGGGSSSGVNTSSKVPAAVQNLSEPGKFSSSAVKVSGLNGDNLEFRVSNNGSRGFSAIININGGNSGRFETTGISTFSQAKAAFSGLYSKYEYSATRFKGKKFSARDMSDLTRT